jgi:N utilization substance protein B
MDNDGGEMKRRELREHIFQLLFRVEFNEKDEMAKQVGLFVEDMEEETEVKERDKTYISEKYAKIVEKLPEIDKMLDEVSKGWKTSRMGKVELTILRLAVYEMRFDEDIPQKVAINEAVELSKKFGGNEAPAFVNGVLAKLTGN